MSGTSWTSSCSPKPVCASTKKDVGRKIVMLAAGAETAAESGGGPGRGDSPGGGEGPLGMGWEETSVRQALGVGGVGSDPSWPQESGHRVRSTLGPRESDHMPRAAGH